MVYLFENQEICQQALNIINNNMGYDGVTCGHDKVNIPNNPEHIDYGKAFIFEVEGDTEHHALWMNGVDNVIPYELKEYDSDWFLPVEV